MVGPGKRAGSGVPGGVAWGLVAGLPGPALAFGGRVRAQLEPPETLPSVHSAHTDAERLLVADELGEGRDDALPGRPQPGNLDPGAGLRVVHDDQRPR